MQKFLAEDNYIRRQELCKEIRSECKKPINLQCHHCGYLNGKIKKVTKQPTTVSYQSKERTEHFLSQMSLHRELYEEVSPCHALIQPSHSGPSSLAQPLSGFHSPHLPATSAPERCDGLRGAPAGRQRELSVLRSLFCVLRSLFSVLCSALSSLRSLFWARAWPALN